MASPRRHRRDVFDFRTASVRLREYFAEARDLGPEVGVLALERVEPENFLVQDGLRHVC